MMEGRASGAQKFRVAEVVMRGWTLHDLAQKYQALSAGLRVNLKPHPSHSGTRLSYRCITVVVVLHYVAVSLS